MAAGRGDSASSAAEEFRKCTPRVRSLLDNEVFGAQDFWKGYKLYCFAHYSSCVTSRRLFPISKMGRVMLSLQPEPILQWGAQFDAAIREVWAMMEEYIWMQHGRDCTNLRSLVLEFDDVDKLSSFKNGSLLLQVIDDDRHGTEHLHAHALRVEINTDIFDEVRTLLNRTKVSLADLATPPRLAKRGIKRKARSASSTVTQVLK